MCLKRKVINRKNKSCFFSETAFAFFKAFCLLLNDIKLQLLQLQAIYG